MSQCLNCNNERADKSWEIVLRFGKNWLRFDQFVLLTLDHWTATVLKIPTDVRDCLKHIRVGWMLRTVGAFTRSADHEQNRGKWNESLANRTWDADDPELQIRAARRSELVRASLKFQNARALNFSDGFSTDLPNSKTEMASHHRMVSHQLRKSFLKNPVLSYHGLGPLIFCSFGSNFCKNNFNVYRQRIICMISNRSFQDLKYPSRVIYCRWNIKSKMLKLPRLADSWYLWR